MAKKTKKPTPPKCGHLDLGQNLNSRAGQRRVQEEMLPTLGLSDWSIKYRPSGGRLVWKIVLKKNGKFDYDTYGKPIAFESPQLQVVLIRATMFETGISKYDPYGDKMEQSYTPRPKKRSAKSASTNGDSGEAKDATTSEDEDEWEIIDEEPDE